MKLNFNEMITQGISRTIKQGQRCGRLSGDEFVCRYSHEGNNCVIGHMMTPEELEKFCDFSMGVGMLVVNGWKSSELSDEQIDTLWDIQKAHDEAEGPNFVQKFTEALRSIREVARLRSLKLGE